MISTWMARAALAVLLVSGGAHADEATAKKQLGERFPDLPIQSMKPAPIPGWYEVFSGDRLFYVDDKADFIFVGSIIDAKTKRNLTEERIRDLLRVKFDALPFGDAIKIVKGDGKRKLAVFEDPDCPYCKRLDGDLAQLTNYTLYVFLYPIDQLHPDASNKSKKVWCAKDRATAWNDVMTTGQVPQNKGDCATPIARIAKLASQLRINGTPAIIFEDGRMVPGAIPKAQLEKILSEAAAAHKAEPKPQETNKK
ncbi:MAG: DsbC family protein [Burkholderiales bacterium]